MGESTETEIADIAVSLWANALEMPQATGTQ